MHVIRHDNGDVEVILNIILVQTALQRDRASRIGQEPSMKCTECDKVALVIALQMRMNRPEGPLIPDVQSHPDARQLPIDRVGIRNLRYPIRFIDGGDAPQPTIARAVAPGYCRSMSSQA